MTKDELIRYLEEYTQASDAELFWFRKIESLKDAINHPPRKPMPATLDADDLIIPFLISLAAGFVSSIKYDNFIGLMVFCIVFLILLFYVARNLPKETQRREAEHKKNLIPKHELEAQLQRARSEYSVAMQRVVNIQKRNILPDDYTLTAYPAKCFLSYLKNGRADTLKEAINLYEIESRQDAIYEETRRHNEEMERQQQRQTELASEAVAEASRAADASEEAARSADFWGAVNTYQLEEILHKK